MHDMLTTAELNEREDTEDIYSITIDLDEVPALENFLQIEFEIIFVHCDEIIL